MKKLLTKSLIMLLLVSVMTTGLFDVIASAGIDGSYSITYHLDGGTNAMKNPDVYTSEDYITLMDATKTGYDFAGWFLDSDKTEQITEIFGSGNVEVYAKFTPKSYSAIFDGNGADECGYKITLLNDKTGEERYVYLNDDDSFSPHEYWKPEANGYVYAGWMYESEVITGTLKINSDIELVPKWVDNPEGYPVLGDSSSAETSQLYFLGDGTPMVKTAKFYTSYEYKSYYYETVLQEHHNYHNVMDNPPDSYSGCCIQNSSGYNIVSHFLMSYKPSYQTGLSCERYSGVFNANPGSFFYAYVYGKGELYRYPLNNVWLRISPGEKRTNIGKIEIDSTVEFDSVVKTPRVRKNGYTFLGWYDSSGNQIPETWQYTENQTFTAKWQPTQYYITYNLYGGINCPDNPSLYTIEDSFTLKEPTKPGYTFKGWYFDADFTTKVTTISQKTGNITLYAKFEVNRYNLTLDANEGEFAPKVTFISEGEEIKKCYLYEKDSISCYRPDNKVGYIFAGWYKDAGLNTLFQFNQNISEDTILYAKWVECESNIINVERIGEFNTTISGKSEQLYAFVPLVDGEIKVTSESNNLDLFGILYNKDKTVLTYADDINSNDLDFSYTYSVKAGQLYYISVKGNTASTSGEAVINVEWNGDCQITGTTYKNSQEPVTYDKEFQIPQKPTREGYVFLGWFDENDNKITDGIWKFVTDKTLTAKWEEATYHTVTFKDISGEIISSDRYYLSEDLVAPNLPTKASDKTYTYTAKWNNNYTGECTGDAVYSPVFESKYIDYTVTFKNWDGTVLSTETYHFGDKISAPDAPTRVADNTYTYKFAGWNENVVDCVGDVTYTATYTSTYIDYTVTFKNWDGTVLSTKKYHYGDKVTVPSNPTKSADNTYTYAFVGWDKDVTNCTGDVTYTATYISTYIDYTVTFKNWDGTVLSTNTYHYGDKVTVPSNPTKSADNIYTYSFAGWDKEVVDCMGNETYTATFDLIYNSYTVTFKNWDGTVLSTKTYHYGDKVTEPLVPTKQADNIYTYTFAGWDKYVGNCIGDVTYTATYTSKYIDYRVTFKNWDGTVLSVNTYHYGDSVTTPSIPTKSADETYTYTFTGWDKTVVNCVGDETYIATFDSNYINYIVTFKNWDGIVLSAKTYHYGDKVTAPSMPTKPAGNIYEYTFVGWDKEVGDCTGDATYTATYTSKYIDYTVTFINWDGTVLSSKTYNYGETVEVPEDPTRESDSSYNYQFIGWNSEVVACCENVEYMAMFDSIHYHTISDWFSMNGDENLCKQCLTCCEILETSVKLATPELTKVANTASGVKVTWYNVYGADSYIVYRRAYNAKTKKWSGWSRLADGETSTSYLDKTAKSGTYYRYTVRANNEAGLSGYNTAGIKTYFISTPKISSTANTSSAITVKWGKVTGATGYIVYRKTGDGKWQNLGKTTGISFTDKTAKSGVTYRYTVKAYYGSYVSAYNTNGYAVRRLLIPTLKSVTSAKAGVTFKWNKVTGATGYIVYRKTGNGSWVKLATVTGNAKISYLDKTAKKGTTYTYTVKAYYGTSTSYYNTKGLAIKDKY